MCRESLIDFECYNVYEDGRIWSKYWKRFIDTNNLSNKGYVKITLKTKIGEERYLEYLLHRVIWYYFNGEIPQELEVAHNDCNPRNCALENLYLATHPQNMNHPITRKRISQWQKGVKKNYPCGKAPKRVDKIDKITGEVYKTWDKITEAANEIGCTRAAIIKSCNCAIPIKDHLWKRHCSLNY